MKMSLKPRNAIERYPQLANLDFFEYISKENGSNYYLLEVKTIEDLLSIDAACRNTDEFYKGLIINGTEITISEEAYTLGE